MRRISHGTALLGGSPFRLIRLSAAGSRLLDGWLAGDQAELTNSAAALRDRLLKAAMVHPVPEADLELPRVTFVVPVYDDAEGLAELLPVLRSDYAGAAIVVVDDASPNPASIAAAADLHGVELVVHSRNRGPGAARNTGWRHVSDRSDVVCFIDADVVPAAESLGFVFGHFADPAVSASAPRVRSRSGIRTLDSYEALASPLDLGDAPGLVRPGGRPSYVPSAALAIRVSALVEVDGFDESMRFGEDVDLIWRLTESGHTIRYDPRAIVRHRNRGSLAALLRQRFGYGSSAAQLAVRHGATVTPLRIPVTILAWWLAAIFGGRLGAFGALAGSVGSTAKLAKTLEGKVDRPGAEAVTLMAKAQVGAGGALVNAANRHYLPLLLLGRRGRRALLAGAIVPPVAAWLKARPRHDVVTHVAVTAVQNAAYCGGVWAGAWRERSPAALLPDVYLSKGNDD